MEWLWLATTKLPRACRLWIHYHCHELLFYQQQLSHDVNECSTQMNYYSFVGISFSNFHVSHYCCCCHFTLSRRYRCVFGCVCVSCFMCDLMSYNSISRCVTEKLSWFLTRQGTLNRCENEFTWVRASVCLFFLPISNGYALDARLCRTFICYIFLLSILTLTLHPFLFCFFFYINVLHVMTSVIVMRSSYHFSCFVWCTMLRYVRYTK